MLLYWYVLMENIKVYEGLGTFSIVHNQVQIVVINTLQQFKSYIILPENEMPEQTTIALKILQGLKSSQKLFRFVIQQFLKKSLSLKGKTKMVVQNERKWLVLYRSFDFDTFFMKNESCGQMFDIESYKASSIFLFLFIY